MIKELYSDIYLIEIPLPNNPLKATNSYFIRGKGRNLLIDTGFNRTECREALDQAIQDIGFSMDNTDIFVTHVHSDHSGLVGYLVLPGTKVYCGNYCSRILTHKGTKQERNYLIDLIQQSGLINMGLSEDLSIHPGLKYASSKIPEVAIIHDGDEITVGDFNFQCIDTTGHAPDHICLYEPTRKILFSGDHILGNITPNNTIWEAPWTIEYDYLGSYLKSLEKISSLNITLTLPGHREIVNDCYSRIKELKIHHEKRLQNILEILGQEKMNGAEVASKMEWNLTIKTWKEYPPAQKIFATGEALAHLTHLVFKKVIVKELYDGVVYYRRL